MSGNQKKTVLSGIQPNGDLHIGNYIGAINVWVENQELYDNLFCIADLHAITVPENITSSFLFQTKRDVAAMYIACGIDPNKSAIFLQSAVPEHTYLTWVFNCVTPLGWLERMTQFKSKSSQKQSVSTGLFTYPLLQAADILLYHPDYVPVGDDQKQHIELTRNIANRFNHLYGEYFKEPAPLIRESGAKIMGLDNPDEKMSKSFAKKSDYHAISITDSANTIKKKIGKAVTDANSEMRFDHASPGVINLLTIYEVLSQENRAQIENKFVGKGYGYLKSELTSVLVEKLTPIQTEYFHLVKDQKYLEEILYNGAQKASKIAEKTVTDVKALTGLN